MGTDWAPGRTKSKIFNMKNTRPCPFMCLLRFKGSTGFTGVCAQRKRTCRDHLRFSTKLHLQDMPISEVGSYIFHVLRLQLNEKADILRNFFLWGDSVTCPGSIAGCAWLWEGPSQHNVNFFLAVQDIVWFIHNHKILPPLQVYISNITICS